MDARERPPPPPGEAACACAAADLRISVGGARCGRCGGAALGRGVPPAFDSPCAEPLLLEAAADAAREGDGRVVAVFADAAYDGVLLNWLAAAQRAGVKGVVVLALDAATERAVAARGWRTVRVDAGTEEGFDGTAWELDPRGDVRPTCDANARLWLARALVLRALLRAENVRLVVHSDADAVWLRDAVPMLDDYDVDLAVSVGAKQPVSVESAFGFVVCCGLMALRDSKPTRNLMDALCCRICVERDDQVALNKLLLDASLEFEEHPAPGPELEAVLHTSGLRGTCRRAPLATVAVIPHAVVPRIMTRLPPGEPLRAVVVHPQAPQEQAAKLAMFEQLGIRFSWEESQQTQQQKPQRNPPRQGRAKR